MQSAKTPIRRTARTGYVCDQPKWPAKKQREILLSLGMPEGRIWTEGHKGETLAAAVKATRGGVLEMAGGFRALGINNKQIMDKLPQLDGCTPMDAETGEKNGAKLVTAALHAVRYGNNKFPEGAAERGAEGRAQKIRQNRCPEPQAKAMWLDLKIGTNAEAARLINNGYSEPWTTQTLARHFGRSGRQIGRRKAGLPAIAPDFVRPGQIYFVQSGRTRVKIGFSINSEKRLRGLSTNHHTELTLIGTMPGSISDERALHERFRKYWVRGEWFRIDGALAKFLRSKAIKRPKKD